jgi:saccharopine dehydrogenase-like NADP-dependent oxidoreductase
MKVLFLGGAGDMARAMVDLMLEEDDLEQVTLADLDVERAKERASGSDMRFSGLALDITDRATLLNAMKRHDLVLNYAGPFYRFERPVAEAAIEAGVHYISIADDYDAYLSVSELDNQARAAGVKIMSGFGNSPGLTQILAKKGYLAMEKPSRIAVNWAGGANEAVGPSNILHVLHLMSGKTLQWRDGHEEYVPCGKGRKTVDFPEPIGRIPTWYTGHAESVSLPRNLPGLDNVSVHGGAVPVFDFQLVAFLGRLGLTTTHERRVRVLKAFTPILPLFQSPRAPDKSAGRVEAWGTDGGQEKYVHYTFVGHIAFITSCPCLQTMLWLKQGAFDHLPGGVYAPERLIEDPGAFLTELTGRGMVIESFE